MHAGKIIALLVVVAVLGFLAWKRGSTPEDPLAAAGQVEIAPGLDPARVAGIRIENLTNRETIRFERDAQGQWWIVDPLTWRADDGTIRELIDFARRGRGFLAPGLSADDAGLRPPRHEIEFVERRVGGDERHHRITIGAPDIDPARVFAMVGPSEERALVRLSSAIVPFVDHRIEHFRDRRLLHFAAQDVTAFSRRIDPSVWRVTDADEDAERVPVDLVAEPQEDGWWALAPASMRLDPIGLGTIVRNATQLRVRGFLFDSPTDLGRWGLDPGLIVVELEIHGGERVTIHIGHEESERDVPFDARSWVARLDGAHHVVRLDEVAVRLMVTPVAYLVDHQIARFDREGTRAATIEIDGRRIALRRDGSRWYLHADGDWRLASESAVGDLLAALARVELAGYPWLAEPDGAPSDVTLDGRIEIVVDGPEGERTLGADLGASTTVRGVVGRPLRRFGESAFGLLAEESIAALLPSEESLLATRLLRLAELEQSAVEVLGDGRRRAWERDPRRGHWFAAGTTVEDRRFALVVDALFTVRAQRWLTPDERALVETQGFERPLLVVVRDASGVERRYTLGRLPGGEEIGVEVDGQRAVVGPGTWQRLVELLERE